MDVKWKLFTMNEFDKFIEHDNHTGIILLKSSFINTLNKVIRESDSEIKLTHIPYSLILECLYELSFGYVEKWNIGEYSIDIYYSGIKIVNICGDIREKFTTIRRDEDTGISG